MLQTSSCLSIQDTDLKLLGPDTSLKEVTANQSLAMGTLAPRAQGQLQNHVMGMVIWLNFHVARLPIAPPYPGN